MEDVLDVYTRPYDPLRPQICMDETSKQLLRDAKEPLPMEPGTEERRDYEYERGGVVNLFLFCAPLQGSRWVDVSQRRTKTDWADQIVLVMDNLNTHTPASLYEAFEPKEARRLAKKLEIHHTPKHGSWLNMAEIELSVLSRQCLDRRVPDFESLQGEVASWQQRRDAAGGKIDWRFSPEDARIKLKRLYPSHQE